MAKTYTKNDSNKHLVVDSITVLRKIKGGGITQIQDNVENLRKAQQTLAQQTENYWKDLAADNVINPEEKKILYKEWKIIESEYIALLKEAEASGLIDSSQSLIDYKNNYEALYSYIIATLKIFDDMNSPTQLQNRELFIKKYDDYYSSRDALRNAITDGELFDLDSSIKVEIGKIQDQLKDITQGSVADGSITVDKLASDLKDDILQFETAAATGFLTDDILKAIDTSVDAVTKDFNAILADNEKASKLYIQLMADRINAIIDDAKRVTRSHLKQTSDSITLSVVNLAKETATQLKLTDEAITAMATDLRTETSAALKITSDRIANMVTGGSSEAYLSLSVGLPYYVTLSKYEAWEKLLEKDTEGLAYLHNIYIKTNIGTDEDPTYYYVIKSDATPTEIKTLTNKLRALDSLSSQVVIDADMVQVKGETVFSAEGTLKQAYYDYNAVTDKNFTYAMFDGKPFLDGTVIKGGLIKTGLIDADGIITQMLSAEEIIVKSRLASDNYYLKDSEGKPTSTPSGKGFLINGTTGNVDFNKGTFRGTIEATNMILLFTPGDYIFASLVAHYEETRTHASEKITRFVSAGKGKINAKLKAGVGGYNESMYFYYSIKKNGTKIQEYQRYYDGNTTQNWEHNVEIEVMPGDIIMPEWHWERWNGAVALGSIAVDLDLCTDEANELLKFLSKVEIEKEFIG